jgi:hypothetical protein
MAAWPATLPAPLLAGYAVQIADNVARTDMEAGPGRARRRSAARNDRVTVSWVFSAAQMDAFRDWFDDADEAAGGAAWFSATLNVGNGSTAFDARFLAAPSAELLGSGAWRVSASWELRSA